MSNVQFRDNITKKDYANIKKIIDEAWNFSHYIKKKDNKDIWLSIFMHTVVIQKNYIQVAILDGEVIGLLCGDVKRRYGYSKNLKHIFNTAFIAIRLLLFSPKEDRKCLRSFLRLQDVQNNLIKDTEIVFDAEIEFFVVGSASQGKGVGKKLLNNYLDYCKSINVINIFVLTDNKCNYGFYEHNGFMRASERKFHFDLYNGKESMDAYIYIMTLQEDMQK